MSAGGSGVHDAVGAFIVHDIRFSGHINFHYDEALAFAPFPIGFATQPRNQIVSAGSNVTFTVSTTGGLPMSYRWFFNQTNLVSSIATNAPASSLTLTNVQLTQTGNYSVVITNLLMSVTSAPAVLFVYTNLTQLAPQLAAPTTSTNGQFQFNIAGVTGLNYAVQTSTNLIDWIPMQTNVSPFNFMDTNMNGLRQRFYRSIFLP
jgi:hypothetical protein